MKGLVSRCNNSIGIHTFALWFKADESKINFFLSHFTHHMRDWIHCNMLLYVFRGGRFEPYVFPTRSESNPEVIEKDIRQLALPNGQIQCISIRIGNEYIPLEHVDEARIISRIVTADRDCFVRHFYEKGFDPHEKVRSQKQTVPQDVYEEKELFKLEFDYEQNADLGTPCFGASGAHKDDVF
jgi:hypothetical protein